MDLFIRYKTFIREHSSKEISVNDIKWKYLIGGSGEEFLLLLPGGTRQPGMRFQFLSELEEKFRTIYPYYPLVCQMKQLINGLAAILDNESLTKTHIFGSSFGGLVGQYLLKEYPDRISKLILNNTGTVIIIMSKSLNGFETC
ncbi:MAG: alpha/beta fold hydrolase [Candidatus Hodarchaeota archaeon]